MLCILDEFSREALAIKVGRRLAAMDVIETLADLFEARGVPGYIRSDQGPEFIAKAVRQWIAALGARTVYIEKASPWENGYVESFNGKFRDELLNGEIFYTLREARIMIEAWRRHLQHDQAAFYRPPAPEGSCRGRPRRRLRALGRPHQPWPHRQRSKLTFKLDHPVGAGQSPVAPTG